MLKTKHSSQLPINCMPPVYVIGVVLQHSVHIAQVVTHTNSSVRVHGATHFNGVAELPVCFFCFQLFFLEAKRTEYDGNSLVIVVVLPLVSLFVVAQLAAQKCTQIIGQGIAITQQFLKVLHQHLPQFPRQHGNQWSKRVIFRLLQRVLIESR